ncbi:MAG: hypothetical protein HC875_39630 [Anaerolineales bacterium]|nr:hypothetical protein [Anaerolineales bacterium]
MPRYAKTGPTPAEPPSTLASRIKAGKVVPIISNMLGNDLVLGGHARLVAEYARLFHLGQPHDLAHLLQLKSLTDKALAKPWDLGAHYLEFVKNQLFDLAAAAAHRKRPWPRLRLTLTIYPRPNFVPAWAILTLTTGPTTRSCCWPTCPCPSI